MGSAQSTPMRSPLFLALQALCEILASMEEWRGDHAPAAKDGNSVRVAFQILSSQFPTGTGRVGVAYFPFKRKLKAFFVAPRIYALKDIPISVLSPEAFLRDPNFARAFSSFASTPRPLDVVFDMSLEDYEVQGEYGPCSLPDKEAIAKQTYHPLGARRPVVFRRDQECGDACCVWDSAPVQFVSSRL
jgi:hypothetical protein